MGFSIIVWVLFLHWWFDFFCQNDEMAINKSKSFKWLFAHTALYSGLAFFVGLPLGYATLFYIFLFVTHSIIDGITSRINSKLWQKKCST